MSIASSTSDRCNTSPRYSVDVYICDVYSDEARSSETLVAETGDSTAGSTMPDGPSSTGAPPAAESTAVETECADVAPRPQSVVATDNKNCSAREAIVRTSQISALVASTNCRWYVR